MAAPRTGRVNLENDRWGGPCCGPILPIAAILCPEQTVWPTWTVTRLLWP